MIDLIPPPELDDAARLLGVPLLIVPERRDINDAFVAAFLDSGERACVVANNATDTRRVQRMLRECSGACLICGRPPFRRGSTGKRLSSTEGKIVFGFGVDRAIFKTAFEPYGVVLYPCESPPTR